MEEKAAAEVRPKRKAKKRIILLAILMVIVGVVWLVIHALTGPASGSVSNSTAGDAATSINPIALQTNYFTATYPSAYKLAAKLQNNDSASLDHWTLDGQPTPDSPATSHINLIITNLPAGGVTEDSAYKLYQAFPQTYTLSKLTYQGDNGYKATAHDTTYRTFILWPHKKYLLTASLVTPSSNGQADQDFQTVLDSIRWKD